MPPRVSEAVVVPKHKKNSYFQITITYNRTVTEEKNVSTIFSITHDI